MSHAKTADKLLIKPAAGARPAPASSLGHITRKDTDESGHAGIESLEQETRATLTTVPKQDTRTLTVRE